MDGVYLIFKCKRLHDIDDKVNQDKKQLKKFPRADVLSPPSDPSYPCSAS